MRRHRRKVQNVMKHGPTFGWMMVRPDGTAVYSVPKKETRISQRLMREVLEDANLRVMVETWMQPYREVFIPDPDREPGEWSPFAQDGRVDEERLKEEGWYLTGALREEQKHE